MRLVALVPGEVSNASPANRPWNRSLNQPVIVSEEALAAPVLVTDLTPDSPARAAGPAYIVLAGISFLHFLNDTIQSLIASVYPILKGKYALAFAPISLITLAFPVTTFLVH